jgi:hypothetical protein
MAAATRPQSRPASREIDEQTDLGEVYMRSLLRAQLRLGVSVPVVVGVFLGALPVLFALEPQLAGARIGTVPLLWLLVGVPTSRSGPADGPDRLVGSDLGCFTGDRRKFEHFRQKVFTGARPAA